MDFMDFSYQGVVDRIRVYEMCRTRMPWAGSMGEAKTLYPNLVAAFEAAQIGGVEAFAERLRVSYDVAVGIIERSGEITPVEKKRICDYLHIYDADLLFASSMVYMSEYDDEWQDFLKLNCDGYEDITKKYHGATAWESSRWIYTAEKAGVDVPVVVHKCLHQRIWLDDLAYRDSLKWRSRQAVAVRNTRI